MKVAILEDETPQAELALATLQASGHTCVWFKSGQVLSDSSGRLRLLWTLSGASSQRLSFSGYRDDVVTVVPTVLRPAMTLVADTIVSSGPFAVCVQQGGRIGKKYSLGHLPGAAGINIQYN